MLPTRKPYCHKGFDHLYHYNFNNFLPLKAKKPTTPKMDQTHGENVDISRFIAI